MPKTSTKPKKLMIGWRESVSLPDLNIESFSAKIDTGARTTAIHASDIRTCEKNGVPMVEFTLDHQGVNQTTRFTLPVHHKRAITNTSGVPEERFLVLATINIGERSALIEVSLSNRSDMRYPMIVGRTALRLLKLTVDPTRSWLQSSKPQKDKL